MKQSKQPRYFLVPLPLTPATEPKVALECLVRTMGDTHGLAKILHSGGLELWRLGKRVGTFKSFNELYAKLDKIT